MSGPYIELAWPARGESIETLAASFERPLSPEPGTSWTAPFGLREQRHLIPRGLPAYAGASLAAPLKTLVGARFEPGLLTLDVSQAGLRSQTHWSTLCGPLACEALHRSGRLIPPGHRLRLNPQDFELLLGLSLLLNWAAPSQKNQREHFKGARQALTRLQTMIKRSAGVTQPALDLPALLSGELGDGELGDTVGWLGGAALERDPERTARHLARRDQNRPGLSETPEHDLELVRLTPELTAAISHPQHPMRTLRPAAGPLMVYAAGPGALLRAWKGETVRAQVVLDGGAETELEWSRRGDMIRTESPQLVVACGLQSLRVITRNLVISESPWLPPGPETRALSKL